jgi:hypothetical protein
MSNNPEFIRRVLELQEVGNPEQAATIQAMQEMPHLFPPKPAVPFKLGGAAMQSMFSKNTNSPSASALDLPQAFITTGKNVETAKVQLDQLFKENEVAFKALTKDTIIYLAVRGASAKKMIVAKATEMGTVRPKWAGMVINIGSEPKHDELTWPRMCAIVTLWAQFGKLHPGVPIKERGAMSLALSRVNNVRFQQIFECLIGPGYHLCGGVLFFGSASAIGYEPAIGDIGLYFAGGLMLDYLNYTTEVRKKGGIASNFPDWIATQPDVPMGGILQKCIICSLPEDGYQFPAIEADAMSTVTTQEIYRVTGGKAHKRAIDAFTLMKNKIFKT